MGKTVPGFKTKLPLEKNSNDFVFDNQLLAQCIYLGARIGEVSCPTRYAADSSSINLRRSIRYGLGVLHTSLDYRLHRHGLRHCGYLDFKPGQLRDRLPEPGPVEEPGPRRKNWERWKSPDGKKTRFAISAASAEYLQKLSWKVYQREIENTKPAK